MTGQFDPALLIPTAIRAVVSTVFGRFADRREAIAATNIIAADPADTDLDYSSDGAPFWFDFLADTGDGWNPTYAMARLVSEDALAVGGKDLPRGRLLLLGGDQVYPSASREEYAARFRAPFEEAYAPGNKPRWDEKAEDSPHLYALPGDHDWHDGLNAFFGLFCRRRIVGKGQLGADRDGAVIAGRKTWQTRSYFAVQLPGKWWLWGTDSQMEGYIDQPQIDYFLHAATRWMDPASKLILCVAEPAWANVDPKNPDDRYRNLNYLEQLALTAKDPDTQEPMRHELKLVLTGDSHHYARFVERTPNGESRQYIVCGGGGAFTSATHHLRSRTVSEIESSRPGEGPKDVPAVPKRTFEIASTKKGEESLYPDMATSRRLSWRNLLFPFINIQFTFTLVGYYLLFAWILSFNAAAWRGTDLAALFDRSLWSALEAVPGLVFVSPAAPILLSIILVAYVLLADAADKLWLRGLLGIGHALVSFSAVMLAIVLVVRCLADSWDGGLASALILAAVACAAGFAAAFVFGLYFIFSMLVLRRDTGFGFSALKLQGHNSFLRLCIDGAGTLTVYPIGLERVPDDRGETLKNPPLRPHLIERPIEIR
jgi:hypothetical protein